MTYGWMGRSPDYKAAFLATLGANADFYAPYQDNARRWYRDGPGARAVPQPRARPPAGGPPPPGPTRCRRLRARREGDRRRPRRQRRQGGGHRLGAHHYNFIAHSGAAPIKTKEFALVFVGPMDTPGVKLICRPSYAMTAEVMGSPFDYPLSQPPGRERRDPGAGQGAGPLGERLRLRRRREGQHLLPALRLLPARSCSTAARAWPSSSTSSPACCSRRVEATGADDFRGVQARIGEVHRLAQPVLGPDRRHGAHARCRGPAARVLPNSEYGAGLPRVHDHRLSAGQGDHRAGPRQRR